MNANLENPGSILEHLATLTMGAKAIESAQTTVSNWRGFAFQIDHNLSVVFPFTGGFEILPDREIQPVPWAKLWVRGMTNVRGDVYTVVDFANYIGLTGVRSQRTATLFKLPSSRLKSVLLMGGRVVLRTFSEILPHVKSDHVPLRLEPYVSTVIEDDDGVWVVLDVEKLCESKDFINISDVQ